MSYNGHFFLEISIDFHIDQFAFSPKIGELQLNRNINQDYHEVRQSVDELADFFKGRSLVHEFGSVTIQDDFFQMLQIAIVDQSP